MNTHRLEQLDRFWAHELGIDSNLTSTPRICCTVQHLYSGVQLFANRELLVVASPPSKAELTQNVIADVSPEEAFSVEWLQRVIADDAEWILGPAEVNYADGTSFRSVQSHCSRILLASELAAPRHWRGKNQMKNLINSVCSRAKWEARGFLTLGTVLGACLVMLTAGTHAQQPTVVPSSGGFLVVTSFDTGNVMRYREATGTFVDTFVPKHSGGLNQPFGVIFGPHDHNLYVSSGEFKGPGQLKAILRYDGTTGAFIDNFAQGGELKSPRGIIFGPDGNLYVANFSFRGNNPVVSRFQGPSGITPGAFLGPFVTAGRGGLLHPFAVLFGPDGNNDGQQDHYVTSTQLTGNKGNEHTTTVKRYDGVTGAFIDTFVTAAGSGGLDDPTFTETDPVTLAFTEKH